MNVRYISMVLALLPAIACFAGVPLPKAVLSYTTPPDGRSHVILDVLSGSGQQAVAYVLLASADLAAEPQQASGPTWDITVVPVTQKGAGEPLFVCKSGFLKPQQFQARLLSVDGRFAVLVKPKGGAWIVRILNDHGRVERDVTLSNSMQRSPSFAVAVCSGRIAVIYGRSIDLVDVQQGICETRRVGAKDAKSSMEVVCPSAAGGLLLAGSTPVPGNAPLATGTAVVAVDRGFGLIRSAAYPGVLPRAVVMTRPDMTSLVYLAGGAGNPLRMRVIDSELQSRADEKVGDWNNILGSVTAVRVASTERTAVLYPQGLAGDKIVYCLDIRDDKARRVAQYDVPTNGIIAHVVAGSDDELLWIALSTQEDALLYSPYSGQVIFLRGRQLQPENNGGPK